MDRVIAKAFFQYQVDKLSRTLEELRNIADSCHEEGLEPVFALIENVQMAKALAQACVDAC